MKTLRNLGLSRLLFLFILVWMQSATSGCSLHFTKYTDGPLTQYLTEPVPTLDKPMARTLSVERVMYNTAGGMKAIMISDLVAGEIYFVPKKVGREVKELLKLDEAFSKEATYAGLNAIAKNRAKAWHLESNKITDLAPISDPVDAVTQQYIQVQESKAKEAYKKGEYLKANNYNSAAMNAMTINQSSQRAQAVAGVAFAAVGAMEAIGRAVIKNDFMKLRNWIELESGAIGPEAPEGNHLSVFFLKFLEGKKFNFDGRVRFAVFLVVTDKNGDSTSVLEGSDTLLCEDECNVFQPKPTAKLSENTFLSADVEKQFGLPGGNKFLSDNGFSVQTAIDQYLLLQHGLQKLSKAL